MYRLVWQPVVTALCFVASAVAADGQALQSSSPQVLASAQTPAPAPAPAQTPAPADAAAADTSRSLFAPTRRQFQLGGRFTNVDGDEARFQRYQDVRDGVLFTDAKYAYDAPNGAWLFRGTADNLGW